MDIIIFQPSHHLNLYISTIWSWPLKVLQNRSGVVEIRVTPLWRHKYHLCLASGCLSITSWIANWEFKKNLRELNQGNMVDDPEVRGHILLLLPWWRLRDVVVHCLRGKGHVLFVICFVFSLPIRVLESLLDPNNILCSCVCLQAEIS